MDAGKLGGLREALDVYDVDRREALLNDRGSEVTRFLMRLGAYDAPYRHYDGPEEEYRDWNGALVGSGPSARVREAIPADATLPAEELAPLAEWGTYARQLAARHPAAQAAVLKRIVPGADPQTLHDIALHKNADVDLFALLAHDERSQARRAAAESVRCPLALLELLACDGDSGVRLAALRNRSLQPRMQWLTDELEVRRAFANHPLAPPEMLAVLAHDTDALVRNSVAGNHATPSSVLANLGSDPLAEVRKSVASNANATAQTWNGLALDKDRDVRLAVASQPLAPAAALAVLAGDADDLVREFVARNRETPASVLADLATDPATMVRIFVAGNPHATIEIWEALGLDSDAAVRSAVAGSSYVPADLKARLAREARRH